MRRGLFRAVCPVLLVVLVLSLSGQSMGAVWPASERLVATSGTTAGDIRCTGSTSIVDVRVRWRALPDRPEGFTCEPSTTTVLIVRDRLAPGAATTAATSHSERAAQIAGTEVSGP